MSEPPLSPSSLAKRCFGASDDEDEVLTPGQRPSSEPALSPRVYPAHPQPPPPPTDINPPPSKKPKLDSQFVKAQFDAYERRVKQKKDSKVKAKSSSNPSSGSKPSASKSGNRKPATYAATLPPTFNQYDHGHSSTAPQQPYTRMAPPPNPMHWGVGGPYSGTQGYPSYYPGQHQPGFNYSMPQQSAFPPWNQSQWTALPYQGYGFAPPMDRHWPYAQPQQG